MNFNTVKDTQQTKINTSRIIHDRQWRNCVTTVTIAICQSPDVRYWKSEFTQLCVLFIFPKKATKNHKMRYLCFYTRGSAVNICLLYKYWTCFPVWFWRQAITQISSLRPWKVWMRTTRWFLVSLFQLKGKKLQAKLSWQRWEIRSEWMILLWTFGSLQKVSIATIQWENVLKTVDSKTTNWSCNGTFTMKSAERVFVL